MKNIFTVIALSLLTTPAFAVDEPTQPINAEAPTENFSKQTWPHFSSSCLRNDKAVKVRLVTETRR